MDLIQPLLAVFLVLGMLCAALWFLRSRGAAAFHMPRMTAGGVRNMEVLERVALGPQQALHLVRVGERRIVVATGPGTCQLLLEAEK